jgi:hypothetical protein
MQKTFGAMIFFVHFVVEYLNRMLMYLNISTIQIRYTEVRIESDGFNMMLSSEGTEPVVNWLKLTKDLVVDKYFKTENFLFLQLGLV